MKLIAAAAAALVASVAFATVVACTGDDPDLVSNGVDAGAGADSGPAADTGAGTGDSGVIARGGFESTNCLGWTPNGATLESDPVARGGSFSCRLCDENAGREGPVWGTYQVVSSLAPGTYAARAFVRTSGDAGPFEVYLGLQAVDGTEQAIGDTIERKVIIAPGDDWTPVTTKLVVEPGQGAALSILSRSGGSCFLVDDVELVKE